MNFSAPWGAVFAVGALFLLLVITHSLNVKIG